MNTTSTHAPIHLVLASQSPRRREILETLGLRFRVEVPDIDESATPGEAPEQYVARIACAKADAIRARIDPSHTVLAADTSVVVGTAILGKPTSDTHALSMLRMLMGAAHDVLTAIAVGRGALGQERLGQGDPSPTVVRVVRTRVHFAPASDASLEAYIASGEGRDKAGAYAVQGRAMGFVTRLEGSYSNVVGLPAAETLALLQEVGALSAWPLAPSSNGDARKDAS